MANLYNRPGTTLSVVRRTATPIVGSPDLAALCVGPGQICRTQTSNRR